MTVGNVTADITNAISGVGTTDPWVLVVAFLGAVAGVSYRTIYPWLERAKEEEAAGRKPINFLAKYKFTMGIAFLLAIVTTMGGFDQLTRNLDEAAPLGTIFIVSFTSAIGWNELTNRVSYKISDKLIENKEAEKPASPTASGTTTTPAPKT
jgi:hypothetical protein